MGAERAAAHFPDLQVRPSNELGARNSQNPGLLAVIGLLRTLEGHALFVNGVAVTGDGKRAVSASGDSTLKVWDLETGKPAATFHCDASAGCCAFADNQKIIAGDYGDRLHFLKLEDPQPDEGRIADTCVVDIP